MTQGDLFANKPAPAGKRRTNLPEPWRRTDNGVGKIGATYAHSAGYVIQQCGHPTALWPYALYGPDGYMILAPNGRAFQNLVAASVHVERLLRGLR
jgi:hypothetical protein